MKKGPLSIFLLGGFDVRVDEEPVQTFESDKVRALLAYLAVEGVQPQRREKLAGLLWPDLPEQQARHNLSQTLYNLRKAVAGKAGENETGAQPFLLVTTKTIQLNPASDYWLDVTAFQVGLCGCAGHRKTADSACELCLNEIKQALALYQGDFLHGLTLRDCQVFEEWSLIIREGLRQKALTALIQLCGWQRQAGRLAEALESARRLAILDPLWEEGQRELITCLWLRGERAEAMAQYHAFKQILREELGIEPDGRTQALAARLQASPCEELSGTSGPLSNHNLPVALTPLVGRDLELERLSLLLQDAECRLATVVGLGGSGKTRLAVAAGWRLRSCFADGVYLVRMSGLPSVEALLPAIAQAVGLRLDEAKKPLEQLEGYLQQKQVLLVMDSFEWLLPGAEMVLQLLRLAPGLKVLATSRARLNVKSEYLFPLAGLRFPTSADDPGMLDYGAVRLFMAEAKRVQVGYEPTPADWAGIQRVCELVRGMPLGILLAAARLEQLAVADVAAALARSFDFLEVAWQDVPSRQRSLRATFEYSWQLLDGGLQDVLARLGVFRGGFTEETAATIAEAGPAHLRQLTHYTLIQPANGGRYLIHDLVGEFVQEKLKALGETADQAQARHAHYFLERLQRWGRDLKNGRQRDALAEMDEEASNIIAAWQWAAANGCLAEMRTAHDGLCRYFYLRVRFPEGEQLCRQTLAEWPDSGDSQYSELFLLLQIWQARFNRLLGNGEEASKLRQDCQEKLAYGELAGQEMKEVKAWLAQEVGEAMTHTAREEAVTWFQQALALYQEMGDEWGAASALAGLGEVFMQMGSFVNSTVCFEQSQALFRQVGDLRGTAVALTGLGHSLFRVGQLQEGEECIRESIGLYEMLGDKAGMSTGFLHLARAIHWQGRLAEAGDLFQQCLTLVRDTGFRYETAFAMVGVSLSNMVLGDNHRAREYAERVLKLHYKSDFPRILAFTYLSLGCVELAQGNPQKAVLDLQRCVDLNEEVGQQDERAGGVACLALAQLQLGDVQQARKLLCEALQTTVELEAIWAASWTLPMVALFLTRCGLLAKACEARVFSGRLLSVANSHWMDMIAREETDAALVTLPEEVAAAAKKRGQEGELFSFAREVLELLKTADFA